MLKRAATTLIVVSFISFLFSCASMSSESQSAEESESEASNNIVLTYANIAHAVYQDSLIAAQELSEAIDALVNSPSQEALEQARKNWIRARVPYQQSEVFRFGNAIVDDWEGQLNAWPLDEGLIDYVNADYEYVLGNPGGSANIIANATISNGRDIIDVSDITPELIASLNEFGGSESNVASGYHAIEFLLWGQDLNGTEVGAGDRPYSDFKMGSDCSNGHCKRRSAYLKAAVSLLIQDLEFMVDQWSPNGEYRAQLLSESKTQVLRKMLFGMGSLSLGELAGERMKVALEANSPEDEHDCFSDNTHNSHYYNALGVKNIYLGKYQRLDGTLVSGKSLSDLIASQNHALNTKTKATLDMTMASMESIVEKAESDSSPMPFDVMIAEDNEIGRALIENAIDALVAQTASIEEVAVALGISQLNPETADHRF